MRILICFLAFTLMLLARASSGLATNQKWPAMAEFTAKFRVDTSDKEILLEMPLLDIQGKVRYGFICAGGSERYLEQLGASEVNYVGPLSCRLVEGKRDPETTEESLLSEDESAYWFSRGQIHDFRELTGTCGEYPEYGARRHFRLRGFELTLYFEDIEVDKTGEPTYLTLEISLRRDPKIKSPQAEQTGYLTPYKVGRSCDAVLKGNEPRMCRDRAGDWTECSKLGR